ncbi:WD repeat-containing protein 97-like isoform X2 [Haliotis asinina]|uniref:WD repeat-containing protein 97-like isoform X2 n=1 Tax=Haliotis asinina TaxID=109174 RepID=UPI0035319035
MMMEVHKLRNTTMNPRDVTTGSDDQGDTKDISALEILVQRRNAEERRKARHHWTLLRNSIKHTVDAVANSDIRDIVISHGIHHERKLNHTQPLQNVVFVSPRKEYLTTDGKIFNIFMEDGRRKTTVTPEEPMNRVVYSTHTDQYVGWLHDSEMLYLLDADFEIISQARCPGNILLGTYNQNTGEMVTLGSHFLQSWSFRYGARHLIPRLTTRTDFGDDNMFSMIVLEETASHTQRAFLSCGLGVVVYNLFEGKMLEHRKELHRRTITAMTFFNPLKYLVTGAQDGSIKIWDNDWHVVMVFVGHRRLVNQLAVYPHGPSIISASLDCTIRVWNMETCDEVDRITMSEPAEGLGTSMQYDIFHTFAGKKVDLWRIQHLYQMHTAVGHRVMNIKMTTHPNFVMRAVLMCRDSSIRIVSPPTGNVITTMLMDPGKHIIDAAYAIEQEMLFTVLGNGDIIKCRTNTNPCSMVARWKCQNPDDMCNYLLVYEYVVDSTARHDIWALMKKGVATRSIANLAPSKQSRNRTLLLGGRKDGYICVFNWETGAVDFKVEAHGSKGVLNMIANSRADQVISAGMDNVIKVWRLYPFAQEALTPLMSFYCAHTPSFMTTIKTRLCVAFQDPSTATFSTVLYNLKDKDRFDHKPDDDHFDLITGMTSCPRMKLFATSSMDGTIRIWNETNTLTRLLRLNTTPLSIGFCSHKGDLLLGTGDHLFKIPHERFLPRAYKFRMVSMKFEEEPSEEPIAYDDNLLNMLSKQDVKRLKNSKSSFKFEHFVDLLSAEEEQEVVKEKTVKKEAFAELEAREKELLRIRDGELKAKVKPMTTKETKSEAFLNYMKMFYDKPKIKFPDDDPFPEDTVMRKLDGTDGRTEEDYQGVSEPAGFFPARPPTPAKGLKPAYPINHSGFIPNSVLVKLLWPPPRPVNLERQSTYAPPSLTADQLDQINKLKKDNRPASGVLRSVTFATGEDGDTVRVFDWGDDDEDEDGLKTPTSPQPGETGSRRTSVKSPEIPKLVEGKSSSLMSKMQNIMARPPTPQEEEEPFTPKMLSQKSASPYQDQESPESTGQPTSPPLPTPPKREIKPLQPIRKLVSRPRVPLPSPSPSPEIPTPTPPPPPTPLPNFIKQFIGTEWFEKYFPNCNEKTMPKPWTSDTLANMVLKLIRIAETQHKTAVVEALTLLFTQESLTGAVTVQVQKAIYSALNHHSNPPTCAVEDEKAFILSSIRCLQVLAVKDIDFVVEMMVQFLDGDREVRSSIMDTLFGCGLQDPHRNFQKELDSWDIWNLDDSDRKMELRRMCQQWLNRWMTSYKLHIEDTIDRMKKGQNVHGKMTRGQIQKQQGKLGSSAGGDVSDDQTTLTTLPDGVQFVPTASRSMTITYDKMPDQAVVEAVTYLDAVGYFCEMMVEKEIEALKKGRSRPQGPKQDKPGPPKNTVLVLPKLPHKGALVRLGETHTSVCRRSRDKPITIDFHCPPLGGRSRPLVTGEITTFVPSINLPMKTLYMNPFANKLDEFDARFQEPVLITLKSSQKFFVPAQSYIPMEHVVAPSS